MTKSKAKTQIWENLLSLMTTHYGGENLSRLARDTRIGPGSTSRIKAQDTSVGVDVLEKIAEHFKVEPWELMAPDIGAVRALGIAQADPSADDTYSAMLTAFARQMAVLPRTARVGIAAMLVDLDDINKAVEVAFQVRRLARTDIPPANPTRAIQLVSLPSPPKNKTRQTSRLIGKKLALPASKTPSQSTKK